MRAYRNVVDMAIDVRIFRASGVSFVSSSAQLKEKCRRTSVTDNHDLPTEFVLSFQYPRVRIFQLL